MICADRWDRAPAGVAAGNETAGGTPSGKTEGRSGLGDPESRSMFMRKQEGIQL